MGCDFVGKIYIPHEELIELLIKHNPALGKGGEWAMGPIENGFDCLEIEVAYSDYVHPNEWSLPPPFIQKEREARKKVSNNEQE